LSSKDGDLSENIRSKVAESEEDNILNRLNIAIVGKGGCKIGYRLGDKRMQMKRFVRPYEKKISIRMY
jgi:hypothetical protein